MMKMTRMMRMKKSQHFSSLSLKNCQEDELQQVRNAKVFHQHYMTASVMFKKSVTTVNDAVEMVVAFCLQFGTSQKRRTKLFEMLKICADTNFEDLNISNYKLSKIFNPPPNVMNYNFYCDKCFKKVVFSSTKQCIRGQKSVCEHCKNEHLITLSNPNYFVTSCVRLLLFILLLLLIFINYCK